MRACGFALDLKSRWRACPTLLLVLGAGCSSALDNRPRPAPDGGTGQVEKAATSELTFPNPDLAAKREAARSSPQSFATLFAYARAVADFCLASLVDESCAPACPPGVATHKPASELKPKDWVLVQDALVMLAPLKEGQGLPPAQFEQFVAAKGRLLGLAGHAAEERTLIDSYALAHPDALSVVRRRLEILRQAGDVKESETQCRRSRVSTKSAADAARLEILTTCVSLHPENRDGRTDPPDYTRYLPDPAKAEQRLYRKHLVKLCVEGVGTKEARCGQACACKDQPREQKVKCKQACRECRSETAQKIRECKKTGGVSSAIPKPGASRPDAPRPKAGDSASDPGPELPKTVL